MRCKSGIHEWINPEDAGKCCAGFHRELVIGDTTGCSNIGSAPLPGGIQYGYKWIANNNENNQAPKNITIVK
ncbi:MAG: hypothetical protein PHW62_01610 [Candidatus Ratteibacteria bacterium]|nr:hypothetical protein [Candidatus Ratteibacteria bacterium]